MRGFTRVPIAVMGLQGESMKLTAALVLTAMLSMGNAGAGDTKSLDYDACRALVEAGEILSMSELMELVSSLSDGKILETRLLQQDDSYIYEMEIAGSDGMVKMLFVDARTGAVAEPVVKTQN